MNDYVTPTGCGSSNAPCMSKTKFSWQFSTYVLMTTSTSNVSIAQSSSSETNYITTNCFKNYPCLKTLSLPGANELWKIIPVSSS